MAPGRRMTSTLPKNSRCWSATLTGGDAAGVDGVGYFPVGSFGQTVVIAEVGQGNVDGPGGDVQAGAAVEGVPDHVGRARGNG